MSQGGGNLVSQGGGNLVAQGGGNLVSQGGGNLVSQGGGNLVSQGGGNLVAQGGGNLVSQGGGNLVAQGGGNLVSQGGGNLVAQGAGNFVPEGPRRYGTLSTPETPTSVMLLGELAAASPKSSGGAFVKPSTISVTSDTVTPMQALQASVANLPKAERETVQSLVNDVQAGKPLSTGRLAEADKLLSKATKSLPEQAQRGLDLQVSGAIANTQLKQAVASATVQHAVDVTRNDPVVALAQKKIEAGVALTPTETAQVNKVVVAAVQNLPVSAADKKDLTQTAKAQVTAVATPQVRNAASTADYLAKAAAFEGAAKTRTDMINGTKSVIAAWQVDRAATKDPVKLQSIDKAIAAERSTLAVHEKALVGYNTQAIDLRSKATATAALTPQPAAPSLTAATATTAAAIVPAQPVASSASAALSKNFAAAVSTMSRDPDFNDRIAAKLSPASKQSFIDATQGKASLSPAAIAEFSKATNEVTSDIAAAKSAAAQKPAVPAAVATAPAAATLPATAPAASVNPAAAKPMDAPTKISTDQSKAVQQSLRTIPGNLSKSDTKTFSELSTLVDRAATKGLTPAEATTLKAGLAMLADKNPKAEKQHGLKSLANEVATPKSAVASTTPAAKTATPAAAAALPAGTAAGKPTTPAVAAAPATTVAKPAAALTAPAALASAPAKPVAAPTTAATKPAAAMPKPVVASTTPAAQPAAAKPSPSQVVRPELAKPAAPKTSAAVTPPVAPKPSPSQVAPRAPQAVTPPRLAATPPQAKPAPRAQVCSPNMVNGKMAGMVCR